MFVDSHCHLDFPELATDLPSVLAAMREHAVTHALCIGVDLPAWPQVLAIAHAHANLFATVGVHPDYTDTPEPTVAELVAMAATPKVVAVGETGLDYYRLEGALPWARARRTRHNPTWRARACPATSARPARPASRWSFIRAPQPRTRWPSCARSGQGRRAA